MSDSRTETPTTAFENETMTTKQEANLKAAKAEYRRLKQLRGEFTGRLPIPRTQNTLAFPLSEGFRPKGYYVNENRERVTV